MENQFGMSQRKPSKELHRLRCAVKHYDWGVVGQDSYVARLSAANLGARPCTDLAKPYAEFWMGTHDSGPSFLVRPDGDVLTLKSWIESHPDALGEKVAEKWGRDLPFLFKVLSAAKALSIQAHPDKHLARTLHKLKPNAYKDANHKPEMALAITEFKALCGFVSLEELKAILGNIPEIVELVGSAEANQVLQLNEQDDEEKVKAVVRSIFTHLMSASKEMITKATFKMKSRLLMESEVRRLSEKEQLVLKLEKQYPGDVGLICAFFFNYVKLNPGEALYLEANEPHAYLSGECIECMATSDNVVRAGLTPKHRDVQTLCSMLTYKQGYPEILHGVPLNPYITKYIPPFDEFEVDCCILPSGTSTVFPAVPGPSIFLVMTGEATMHAGLTKGNRVAEGDVLFAPADTEVVIKSASKLQLYRAGVNSKFLSAMGKVRIEASTLHPGSSI